MRDDMEASSPPGRPFDPRATPVARRSVLFLMGATALGAGALGAVLEACSTAPVTVALDVDVDSLTVGTPAEVGFTMRQGSTTVDGSTWLVRQASGALIAFDPRCTHALCAYRWEDASGRFQCGCHDGRFALDGTVLAGPPPRALDRFPVRRTATGLEIDVPASFVAPRASGG
jgi:Rieske Fe-S protein